MALEIYFAAPSVTDCPHEGSKLLVNVLDYASTESRVNMTKKIIEKVKPTDLMLDCGGNSLHEAEAKSNEIWSDPKGIAQERFNLSPENIIEYSLKIQPDTIFSLDFPLQKRKAKKEIQNEFNRKLQINIEWAQETSNLWKRHCSHMNLIIPVQAQTMENFEWFMEELAAKNVKFTGISIPSRNIDSDLLVRFLIRLHEMQIPWVHLLGSTRLSYMTILSYFSKHKLFKKISMDSRTWKVSGTKGKYLHPDNLNQFKFTDFSEYILARLSKKCSCPYCKKLSLDNSQYQLSRILCSHNCLVTENLAEKLYRNATSLDKLEKYVLRRGTVGQRVKQAIDALGMVGNVLN